LAPSRPNIKKIAKYYCSRVTAPRVKMKVGTLGEYFRGKKTSQQEVCVIAYSLLFSGVALGMAAKA